MTSWEPSVSVYLTLQSGIGKPKCGETADRTYAKKKKNVAIFPKSYQARVERWVLIATLLFSSCAEGFPFDSAFTEGFLYLPSPPQRLSLEIHSTAKPQLRSIHYKKPAEIVTQTFGRWGRKNKSTRGRNHRNLYFEFSKVHRGTAEIKLSLELTKTATSPQRRRRSSGSSSYTFSIIVFLPSLNVSFHLSLLSQVPTRLYLSFLSLNWSSRKRDSQKWAKKIWEQNIKWHISVKISRWNPFTLYSKFKIF